MQAVHEQALAYYREQKKACKLKIQKQNISVNLMVRCLFKSGLYNLITSSDAQKSIDLFQQAYTVLTSLSHTNPEIRDNADLIAVFIC